MPFCSLCNIKVDSDCLTGHMVTCFTGNKLKQPKHTHKSTSNKTVDKDYEKREIEALEKIFSGVCNNPSKNNKEKYKDVDDNIHDKKVSEIEENSSSDEEDINWDDTSIISTGDNDDPIDWFMQSNVDVESSDDENDQIDWDDIDTSDRTPEYNRNVDDLLESNEHNRFRRYIK